MQLSDVEMTAIEDVMSILGNEYSFDIYDANDIQQEVFLICAELIKDYSESKGELFPYLLGAARNKIISFIRKEYGNSNAANYQDKIAVYNTQDIFDSDILEPEIDDLIEHYSDFINKNISPQFRKDFLCIKEGIKIPYQRKYELLNHIKTCMNLADKIHV